MLFTTPGRGRLHQRRDPVRRDHPSEVLDRDAARAGARAPGHRARHQGRYRRPSPLAGAPGEFVTEGLDGLRDRLAEYRGMGARFAKWRAVIGISDVLPSARCVAANAHALARYAALCQEVGLVPIVEPEVLMEGAHTIERCDEVTSGVLSAVFAQLLEQRVSPGGHAAQAQHGHRRQGLSPSGVGAGGGHRHPALPAATRAGGGAGHRVPVGWPERSRGDRAPERHQPLARGEAVEDHLLVRPRASRSRARARGPDGTRTCRPASRRSPTGPAAIGPPVSAPSPRRWSQEAA